MDVLTPLPLTNWSGPFAPAVQEAALTALEHGRVLLAGNLPFVLLQSELSLLSERISDEKAKNVSYDPATGVVQGASSDPQARDSLKAMMRRYADQAAALLGALVPRYQAS